MVDGTRVIEYTADPYAWAARDNQEHTLALSRIDSAHAAEPQGELRAIRARGVNRHFNAGTLRVRRVGTGRPAQALLRSRGIGRGAAGRARHRM